ncbi:MAG: hypothetical protein V7752_06335 [Halopseudomonas sp.]
MPYEIDFNNLTQLRTGSKTLSSSQLETARAWVRELMDERSQRIQNSVGERHQKELRAQMAKAGISWDEFQNALK